MNKIDSTLFETHENAYKSVQIICSKPQPRTTAPEQRPLGLSKRECYTRALLPGLVNLPEFHSFKANCLGNHQHKSTLFFMFGTKFKLPKLPLSHPPPPSRFLELVPPLN